MSLILNEINFFWKLGFNEEETDKFVKDYSKGQSIFLDLASETIDYGALIRVSDAEMKRFSQKNFIILEAVNRFLTMKYRPIDIHLGKNPMYDFAIEREDKKVFVAVKCLEYEEEYDAEVVKYKKDPSIILSLLQSNSDIEFFCAYTSRLKAGSIEFRYVIFPRTFSATSPEIYLGGLLEEGVPAYSQEYTKYRESDLPTRKSVAKVGDFEISNGMLIKYIGKSRVITIPDGVEQLGSSVFWNCRNIEKVIIPNTVYNLGGDTFLNCDRLKDLTIPSSVRMMGDNPFAICPKLDLVNKSPFFTIEDEVLYNKEKTRLIHCSIKRKDPVFEIPQGVISIGKHCLVKCLNLRRIVVPPSARIMENNPFSNLPHAKVENMSPHFKFLDGILYNKTMSTLIYYEQLTAPKEVYIPEGVRIIGRHSFYNCHKVEKVVIPNSVEIIGYNPFADCPLLMLENHSPYYIYDDGVLYDKTKSELIYYSLTNKEETFTVPDTVKTIGRSAFYKNKFLKEIVLPDSVTTVKKTAFAECKNLKKIHISNNMKKIEGLAFAYCKNLTEIILPKNTKVEVNTFFDCKAGKGCH